MGMRTEGRSAVYIDSGFLNKPKSEGIARKPIEHKGLKMSVASFIKIASEFFAKCRAKIMAPAKQEKPSKSAIPSPETMEIFVPARENGEADPNGPGFGLTVRPLPEAGFKFEAPADEAIGVNGSDIESDAKTKSSVSSKKKGIVMGTEVLFRKMYAAQKPPAPLAAPREKNKIAMGTKVILKAPGELLAAVKPLTSDAESKPALNRATYRNKVLTVFPPPADKISLPGGNYRQELEDVRKLGKVASFTAWSAPKDAEPSARDSVLPVPRKRGKPATVDIKQPPVAALRASRPPKAALKKITAVEWDPIAAGKSAAPVMMTKDPRALAVAAMFAKAVNGPNTRRPIPPGEKVNTGSVSAARLRFEKM